MITFEIDDTHVQTFLGNLDRRAHLALYAKMDEMRLELAALIQTKLSGPVLNIRSSKLHDSIGSDIEDTGTRITASAFTEGVPYAAIHEFGGDIFPVNAPALHFSINGMEVFTQHVHMPERSYMRSSLADMEAEIVAGMESAVRATETP